MSQTAYPTQGDPIRHSPRNASFQTGNFKLRVWSPAFRRWSGGATLNLKPETLNLLPPHSAIRDRVTRSPFKAGDDRGWRIAKPPTQNPEHGPRTRNRWHMPATQNPEPGTDFTTKAPRTPRQQKSSRVPTRNSELRTQRSALVCQRTQQTINVRSSALPAVAFRVGGRSFRRGEPTPKSSAPTDFVKHYLSELLLKEAGGACTYPFECRSGLLLIVRGLKIIKTHSL